ncbi:hypothetical protein [Massilia antarctica]|uniref:hypothetical protein n=1 Tax=Massilia antarctica TaxID=2765360 RepID=UPI0006BB7AD2|nr:hypothetical protein [Massilia sp. H27-R4]MCY0911131.1 hypothetical protein [Massilia sp. H27-R4]CUI05285.1 hypothetical protein BN2497_5347 [Janthinobacterium sp. CG23_2]CUU29071.1 hypothetical protein BN3177_5347 [Janthinobacterium sp. CG23_2]
MTITAIPPLDRTSPTFRADCDTYFATSIPTFTTEINVLATDLTTKQSIASGAASTATTAAGTATTKAGEAVTSANNALTSAANALASELAAAASAATIGTTAAFSDVNPVVKGGTDNTKQLKIECDTLIPTGTTVTLTAPAASGTIARLSDIPVPVPAGLVLLASLTPAGSLANMLNVFTTAYDSYMIVAEGLAPSASSDILLRVATGGSAVLTSSSYYSYVGPTGDGTSAATSMVLGFVGNQKASLTIFAHRDPTDAYATMFFDTSMTLKLNPGVRTSQASHCVFNPLPITGIQMLCSSGANFYSGKIRIYGMSNT